jgi:hypothetical protein
MLPDLTVVPCMAYITEHSMALGRHVLMLCREVKRLYDGGGKLGYSINSAKHGNYSWAQHGPWSARAHKLSAEKLNECTMGAES